MKKISSGFTLIEVMIAAVIVAILAAIALPSYQDSVRKSRRADAKAVLLEAGQWMERFYTDNNCYSNAKSGAGVICGGTAVVLPFTKAPIDGATKYYDITLSDLTATTFTLSAVPITGTGQDKDKCGGITGATLTLNQANRKGVSGTTDQAKIGECWR